ncbi:MAG: sensor histidine kinase [Bacteriovoracaceae bacterium]
MFLARWTKRFKGIRSQLTIVYSTLFGLFICIFAYILSSEYLHSSQTDFDSAVLNYAIDLSEQVLKDQDNYTSNLKIPQQESKKHFPFILGETYFSLRSIDGTILAKGPKGAYIKEIPYDKGLPKKEDYTHRYLSFKSEDHEYRAINLKFSNAAGNAMILQVATPSNIIQDLENRLLLINSLIIPFLIGILSMVSYIIAGNALSPLNDLIGTANSIAATNLSLRVPEMCTGDEIEELSRTFNTLLTRLEKSFKAQENFVANASHQLNTPLAIIKGELDVLESKSRTMEEHERFHKSLREELERLIDLVKNMLLISRVESGQKNLIMNRIRLDELLLGITSRLNTRAKEKRIVLRFNISEFLDANDFIILGEKQLMDCLFENILENAIKYSPEDSVVSINIEKLADKVAVKIQDAGPGINQEELKRILSERFIRGQNMMLPGTGIGLSIAYQIAEYYGARISYEKLQPQGSLFTVSFN